MRVIVTQEVFEYLENIVIILYENEYFGFIDAAKKYVDDIYNDITKNLPLKIKKHAPKYFDKYGKGLYYASFIRNKNTTWYAFFKIYEENGEYIYQVRYITNNHTEIAKYLNIY